IDLGDKELIISTAATNASASSYVKISGIGKVKKNISNGASFTFPVGNIAYNPITITNNNSSADDFTVNIVDEVYANYNSDGVGTTILTSPRVKRTWNIGKANANASSGINLTFNWNSGEVAGTINTPALYHFESGVWVKQTGTTSSPTSTSFTFTGYTGTFSPFSIGDANTNLPVSWLSFTATKQFNTVQLNWATASETNTRDFVVEYSNNAQQWTALTTVPAAGNSTTTRNYSYVHQNPLKGNNYNYYRILQRDIDDKFSYSKIVSIIFNEPGADLQVYPNPVQDQLTIFLAESQLVRLVNAAGATVWKGQLPAGRNTIPVHTYSKGVYVLTAGMQSQRVLIQ
ncbi:MAG: T9SS type A sorting domain-containing protein, partial [Bacteroidota bacterium]